MAELVALADKSGWFIVVVILAAWKFIPAIADKLAPEWMAARRADESAKRASLEGLTARIIDVVENNSKAMTFLSASINTFERALDGNTQQVARQTEIVRRGPTCPLPDCPFMNQDGDSQPKP